jgi:hypothetical protein
MVYCEKASQMKMNVAIVGGYVESLAKEIGVPVKIYWPDLKSSETNS